MADRVRDVLVIGAGVSGLTTGVCLAEAGLSVLVRAERPPGETTSAVAGALWGLHMVESSDRALDSRSTAAMSCAPIRGRRGGFSTAARQSSRDCAEPR